MVPPEVAAVAPDATFLTARTRSAGFRRLSESSGDLPSLQESKVYAFCGLARPQAFFEDLKATGLEIVRERSFADHRPYSRADLRRILADADGLPGLVHALCLEAARSAVARGSQHAGIGRDYLPAVSALGESLGPRLDAAYRDVTASRGRSDRYAHLLWAGALCPGPSFHTDELERGLARIEGHPVPHQGFAVHLGDLLKRGLWTRVQENLYRFADPALKVYVRLRLRKEAPRLLGEDPLQLGLF